MSLLFSSSSSRAPVLAFTCGVLIIGNDVNTPLCFFYFYGFEIEEEVEAVFFQYKTFD